MYVANNNPTVPPAAPILFTNDLKTYAAQSALGTLAQSNGITAYGGDLYWDGNTIISTSFTNPAAIAVWQANTWTMPFVLSDGISYLGSNGNRQPATGSTAIDFDGTTYAVGGLDLNGNTSVFTATTPATGSWTTINLETGNTFDQVNAMAWIPRLNLWIAIADQIWTAPVGAATWTSRSNSDFYRELYDDGTTLWIVGTSHIWHSTNGTSWTGNVLPASFPYNGGVPAPLFYSSSLGLWISPAVKGGIFSGHCGLVWTTAPNSPWTYGYTSPNDPPSVPANIFNSVAQVGSTIYAVGQQETGGTPSFLPLIASSTDGKTWSVNTTTLPAGSSANGFTALENVVAALDGTSFGITIATTQPIDAYSSNGGTTLTSQYNGGRWNAIISAGVAAAVVTATPLDFPRPNLVLQILARIGAFGYGSSFPPPPPPPPLPGTPETGPRKAILYSLARSVFEPIQEFPTIIRAATIEAAIVGVTWNDLPNPWSTYTASWDSFASQDQQAVFLGIDDGTAITWNDLPNPWSTYLQAWDTFPAGGNVDLFSDNSTTDAGAPIPYSMVPALVYESSRQNILLDSTDMILKIASFFELLTVEFDALPFALGNPTPITAEAINLNDPSTFSIWKMYPGPTQNQYSRYIRVTLSGNSFYRAFAFGGATIFVQIQERPSRPQPQN